MISTKNVSIPFINTHFIIFILMALASWPVLFENRWKPFSFTILKRLEVDHAFVCTLPRQNQSTYTIGNCLSQLKQYLDLENFNKTSLHHLRSVFNVSTENCTVTKPDSRNKFQSSKRTRELAEKTLQQLEQTTLPYLEKNIFNSRPKVIFFQGLEGTGHHYVRRVFRSLHDGNFSATFIGYWEMLRCHSYSKVFNSVANQIQLKRLLLNYKQQVLFLNTVDG